jgi:hypothetical protein
MPTANRVEFFDHYPATELLSLPKETHVFYAGRTEHLPPEFLASLGKLYELKEFVLIYDLPLGDVPLYE